MPHITGIARNQMVFTSFQEPISEEISKVYHQKSLTKCANCNASKREVKVLRKQEESAVPIFGIRRLQNTFPPILPKNNLS